MANPDREDREGIAARIYCASFKELTDRGVPCDRADEVSRILERETFIGPSYSRTPEEQATINQVIPYLTANS